MSVMTKQRWIVTEGIPGIASKDEVVIVDPARPGILVSRWVDWCEYPHLMKHGSSLCPIDGPSSPPARASLQLMD